MNRDFDEINNSLTEQMFDQAKYQFQNNQNLDLNPLPLSMLPLLLENLKLSIPDSMMKDYLRCMQQFVHPNMTFKQFTHYVARASLQPEIESQIKNLFNLIDQQQSGTINAEDLWIFIKQLCGSETLNQKDVDSLMKILDQKEMGFLAYEDFIYGLLPK